MDSQEIDKIILARRQAPEAIKALLIERSLITRKLAELGYTEDGPVSETPKPKIGRPKGSKSRAKEPIQIPAQIAKACRELDMRETIADLNEINGLLEEDAQRRSSVGLTVAESVAQSSSQEWNERHGLTLSEAIEGIGL